MEKNFIITQEELTMKYGFGIDLGGTTVKIAYFDETGEMLEKWEIPTDTSENGIRILPDIAAFWVSASVSPVPSTQRAW